MSQQFSLPSWIKKNTKELLSLLASLIFKTTEVITNPYSFFGVVLALSITRDAKSLEGVESDEAYAMG